MSNQSASSTVSPSPPLSDQPLPPSLFSLLTSSSSSSSSPSPITLQPISLSSHHPSHHNKTAFLLYNVLTSDECEAIIRATEERGYEVAQVSTGAGVQETILHYRNSDRYMWDSTQLAGILFSRISAFLPQTFSTSSSSFSSSFSSSSLPTSHSLSCLNERLRFLRYDAGQFFRPHQDGCYMRDDGSERSYLTLQLYLNDGFEGGETAFVNPLNLTRRDYLRKSSNDRRGSERKDRGSSEVGANVAVVPVRGSVLIFDHRLYHEGVEVRKGRKYAMRTDIMYRPMNWKEGGKAEKLAAGEKGDGSDIVSSDVKQ